MHYEFVGPNGYDGFDRLTSANNGGATGCGAASNVTYTYDGLDRQVTTSVGSAAYHYDGLSLTMSDKTASSTDSVYELGSGGPLAVTKESSTPSTQYMAPDGNGSVGTVTASGGTVACSVRYDPFGNPLGGSSTQTNPCNTGSMVEDYFFQSQRVDATTGDYQMGARTYDPTKSAFTTPDQARSAPPTEDPSVGIDPQTRNTFTFVNGDPLNLQDPTGHRQDCDPESCGHAQPTSEDLRNCEEVSGTACLKAFGIGSVSFGDIVRGTARFLGAAANVVMAPFVTCGRGIVKRSGGFGTALDCVLAAASLIPFGKLAEVGGDGLRALLGAARAGRTAEDTARTVEAARAASGTAVAAETEGGVTNVLRVEGPGKARLDISAAGDVGIKGQNTLFLNFGDQARAEEFLARRLGQGFEGTTIKSFQVPSSYVDALREAAVPESLARQFPDNPFLVDVNQAADQFGIRAANFEELLRNIIPGSGYAP